ncbi:TetR/AcrR family transcriptional regulator [Kitasatospora sp. NPDC002227]|uniref:TetR/AcrR family transcriptional regulator n=1 Tax=Kitasatospora sp. NPDC002227 TaxID=3154773 RepID=UPI003320AB88
MKADTGSRDQSTGSTSPRRLPVQQRSLERYERLLDACAGLLDEAGPGALTTKEVAQRAQVPIGTLYQFFSGKDSLLAALAARNLDRYLDRLARRIGAEHPEGVTGFVDLAVEEFIAMKRAVPGFGHLDFGLVDQLPPGLPESLAEPRVDVEHLLDERLDNNAAVAERLQALGGPLPTTEGFPLALRVALEAADAVLKLAFRTDPEGDPALIAECKRLLRRYLAD